MTTFPDGFEAGMRLTPARLNARNVFLVEQGQDQTENSNTTLVDTNLTFTGVAGAEYWYVALISYSADGTPDMHFAWDVPSGASARRFTQSYEDGVSTASINDGGDIIMRTPATTTEINAGGSGDANFNFARDEGIITMGGTSGAVTLQFAQDTSDAADTIFREQSRLLYQRIA